MKYLKFKTAYARQPMTPGEFIENSTNGEKTELESVIGGCNMGDFCIVSRDHNEELEIVVIDIEYFPAKHGYHTTADFWQVIYQWKQR